MLAQRALEAGRVDSPRPTPARACVRFGACSSTSSAETTLAFLRQRDSSLAALPLAAIAVASTAAAAMSFVPATEQLAAPLGTAVLLFSIVFFFPNLANHTFFLLIALLPLVIWNVAVESERAPALGTLRWAAAIVLFSCGLQKVLHGTYFHGEFLAFQVAHGERFARALGLLIPAEEMARLKALGLAAGPAVGSEGFHSYVTAPPILGAGPYRLETPLALAAVNFVWIFEFVAPFFLVWGRTRAAAAALTAVFLFTVETGALEVMFGALFTATMLMFLRRNVVGAALPVFGVVYAYLVGVQIGVVSPWLRFN
jgi:hypothetical protein